MYLHLCLLFLGTYILILETTAELDLPSGISNQLYCEGCIATIKELSKKVDQKVQRRSESRELAVMDELERICAPLNFKSYEYSPPKTVKACKLLVEKHEEEIETAFAKGKDNLEDIICYKISKACEGVDRTTKPKDRGDIDLTGNGKQQKVITIEGTGEDVKLNSDPGNGKKTPNDAEPKTLSKKGKQKKKKNVKKEKKEKQVKKPVPANNLGADNMFNIDINDPGAMEKVMAQIQQVAKEHTANHHKKQEEERNRKEAEEESTGNKDEL